MVARLKDIAAAAAAVAEEAMCFPFYLLAGTVYHVSYPTNSALPALLFPSRVQCLLFPVLRPRFINNRSLHYKASCEVDHVLCWIVLT